MTNEPPKVFEQPRTNFAFLKVAPAWSFPSHKRNGDQNSADRLHPGHEGKPVRFLLQHRARLVRHMFTSLGVQEDALWPHVLPRHCPRTQKIWTPRLEYSGSAIFVLSCRARRFRLRRRGAYFMTTNVFQACVRIALPMLRSGQGTRVGIYALLHKYQRSMNLAVFARFASNSTYFLVQIYAFRWISSEFSSTTSDRKTRCRTPRSRTSPGSVTTVGELPTTRIGGALSTS